MSQASYKILIIGPAWVGDMVMSQTLYQVIKQNRPKAIIDVLAPKWSEPLIERMPEIRRSIVMPTQHGEWGWQKRREIARQLRDEKYDEAIVLPNSLKSALIPWFARIPKRVGWAREFRSLILTDARPLDKKQYPLMIERFMALAFPRHVKIPMPYPRPKLHISPQQVAVVRQRFGLHINQQPVLAICPGAEFGPAKRWPSAYYAEVAKAKLAEGWQVWIFGSKNDQIVAESIQARCNKRCVDLTGRTNLGEAIDLLSCVNQVVTNDSGLMHIAAAVNRPLVVTYGSTDPGFTPPSSDKVKILRLALSCSPCFKRECPLGHFKCLNDLPPAMVLDALTQMSARVTA